MQLNNGTFLITNKMYNHAKLAMWGTDPRDMGTTEEKADKDQLWQLKEEPKHPGYYYICNLKYVAFRLAKWRPGIEDVGSYTGPYHDNQLWRFEDTGDGFYRIYNFIYNEARLRKWGKENDEWGTGEGRAQDDESWKLVPRFRADVKTATIWSVDNRRGSESLSGKVSVTTGLEFSSYSSISTTVGLEQSLMTSISRAAVDEEVEARIKAEIQYSMLRSKEDWSRTSTITFTAPAYKNYRIKQLMCYFSSPLLSDDCVLTCNCIVEESQGNFN